MILRTENAEYKEYADLLTLEQEVDYTYEQAKILKNVSCFIYACDELIDRLLDSYARRFTLVELFINSIHIEKYSAWGSSLNAWGSRSIETKFKITIIGAAQKANLDGTYTLYEIKDSISLSSIDYGRMLHFMEDNNIKDECCWLTNRDVQHKHVINIPVPTSLMSYNEEAIRYWKDIKLKDLVFIQKPKDKQHTNYNLYTELADSILGGF